jgi:hypothetical protein
MFARGDYLKDSKTGKSLIVEAVEGKFLLCKLSAPRHVRRSRLAATTARQSNSPSPRRLRAPTVSQEPKAAV